MARQIHEAYDQAGLFGESVPTLANEAKKVSLTNFKGMAKKWTTGEGGLGDYSSVAVKGNKISVSAGYDAPDGPAMEVEFDVKGEKVTVSKLQYWGMDPPLSLALGKLGVKKKGDSATLGKLYQAFDGALPVKSEE